MTPLIVQTDDVRIPDRLKMSEQRVAFAMRFNDLIANGVPEDEALEDAVEAAVTPEERLIAADDAG